MANNVKFDTSPWHVGFKKLEKAIGDASGKALETIGDEVLRLSTYEVPHDTGQLQDSGAIEPISEVELLVGYNKEYAARLHEHPEYHFQKGRKGKYLEDPIKNNLSVFRRFLDEAVNGVLG